MYRELKESSIRVVRKRDLTAKKKKRKTGPTNSIPFKGVYGVTPYLQQNDATTP